MSYKPETFENFINRCLYHLRDEGHSLVNAAVVSSISPIPADEWPEGMGTFIYCASPWGKLMWSEEDAHWKERFHLVLTPEAGAMIDMEIGETDVLSLIHVAILLKKRAS